MRYLWLGLFLLLSSAAHAADVTVMCYNPSGGANAVQPCQISNAAAVASQVRGAGSGTDTAAHTIIAAQGAGVKIRVSSVQCGRTDAGTTGTFVTLNDSASTIVVVPNNGGGGGNNIVFQIPLVVAANTALTFTSNAGVSTMYCDAQGFVDTQ